MEHEVVKRYRVAISTSVKGVKIYDCTVDIQGSDMQEVLRASDELVAELDTRYPPNTEVK